MTSERYYAIGKSLYTELFSLINTDFSAVMQRGEVSVSAKTKMLKQKLKPRKLAFVGLPQGTVSVNQKKKGRLYIGNNLKKNYVQTFTDLLKLDSCETCYRFTQNGFSSGFNSKVFSEILLQIIPYMAKGSGLSG